ncbi:Uncharacterised protein [Bordetella pertussis]|nr:Uncharacterised protein [Bordetella pertussis]
MRSRSVCGAISCGGACTAARREVGMDMCDQDCRADRDAAVGASRRSASHLR